MTLEVTHSSSKKPRDRQAFLGKHEANVRLPSANVTSQRPVTCVSISSCHNQASSQKKSIRHFSVILWHFFAFLNEQNAVLHIHLRDRLNALTAINWQVQRLFPWHVWQLAHSVVLTSADGSSQCRWLRGVRYSTIDVHIGGRI